MAVELWVDYFLLVEEVLIQMHTFMILEINIPEKNVFGPSLLIWLQKPVSLINLVNYPSILT